MVLKGINTDFAKMLGHETAYLNADELAYI